jgi:hypothetical protein
MRMSNNVRSLLQVALIGIITLSFIWGTLGIGLSPRNFVPITGIIALALSVAYAFIVWDRIPFASANVLTALTAIRAFPGLTLLALFFQTLALIWSIYFCVILIGVYDAIQGEKLVISHNWTIALYCALAVSYCWTFQVLSVSNGKPLYSASYYRASLTVDASSRPILEHAQGMYGKRCRRMVAFAHREARCQEGHRQDSHLFDGLDLLRQLVCRAHKHLPPGCRFVSP